MYAHPEGYERFMGRWSRRLAAAFADFIPLDGAARVLDVGAGTGSLSRAVADARPGALVVGVDPAVTYLAHGRRSVPNANVRFVGGDALALPFPDGAFDATLALLCLHGVADAGRAVAEMRRVTRPGGCIAACEWDFRDGMTLLRLLSDAVVAVEASAEAGHARNTPLGGAGELGALWRASGLGRVEETALALTLDFASFDDLWEPVLAGPTPRTAYIAGLPAPQRAAVRAWLERHLPAGPGGGPFTLTARAWAVRGVAA